MAETLQFIDERLSNSITAVTPPKQPIDRLAPLTFTDWLQYNAQLFTTTSDFLNRYQSYLNNWYAANSATKEQASTGIQQYYSNLITDIAINYSTTDEQRYLQNIDVTNSRDLAIAVPFFAKKIKDICLYYCNLREEVQATTIQYNLKGSNVGIENLLYVSLIKALQTQNASNLLASLNLSLSSISNNLVIDIEELYDLYPDYYDISTSLPASAYNTTTGLRNEYFSSNQFNTDPFLDLNINQSILKAILSYPFYALELGTDFTIDPLVNSSQLFYLKDSDFISTVNDGDVNNLNLQTQALEMSKYMGVDYYYIVTTTTSSAYTSGTLFTANSEFANVLNKRFPTIASIPSQEFLKTAKEVGLFFKPDKIGLTNFNNFKFTASIDIGKLQPNTVYYFPDPAKYGNISGNSKLRFQTPLSFFEENYFNKIDYSNQYMFGDVASDPYYQTFRAYQTREQTQHYSNAGLSRYTDSQDFFTDNLDTIWNNIDVYPLISVSQFPNEERFQSLLTLDKTLVQYKNDVYGNEYGLYKSAINKQFNIVPNPTTVLDDIFDSFYFNTNQFGFQNYYTANNNPPYSLYNLRSVYSGVVLRTSITEQLNADLTQNNFQIDNSSCSTSLIPAYRATSIIDNGARFTQQDDTGNVIVIESYDFTVNDAFTTVQQAAEYTSVIRDGSTFTKNDGSLHPDMPSDQASYDPTNSTLYYNELVDGATNSFLNNKVTTGLVYSPQNPVATDTSPGDFSINPDPYIVQDYDGHTFYDNFLDVDPYEYAANYSYSYVELTNFINERLYDRNTELDYSLQGINTTKPSLYYTRNVEPGILYFKNASSTIIGPASAGLSAAFLNYPIEVQNEIKNNVINFDLYYDTLQIETENYLIFNKIQFDYDINQITNSTSILDAIERGSGTNLEKFSTVWFDEDTNVLMVCVTTLFGYLSASNYKAVYPTIYTINLNNHQTTQIYPNKNKNTLTYNELSAFSLFGTGLEINIVEIEKPILNFSKDTNYFTLTYLGKDPSGCFYIFTTRFQYINNTIININTTMHTPATNAYHANFANYLPGGATINFSNIDTNSIISTNVGYVNVEDNTFTWGQPKT